MQTNRKKPGPKPTRPPTTTIAISVETALLEAFDAEAARQGTPRTHLMEEAMRQYLRR